MRQHAHKNTIIVAFSNKNHLDYTFNWINYVRVSNRDPLWVLSVSPWWQYLYPALPHQLYPALQLHQNRRASNLLISSLAHAEAEQHHLSALQPTSGRQDMACLLRTHHPNMLNTCHGLFLQGLNITNYLVGALDAITARELLRQDVNTFNMYEDGTELPAGEPLGS